MAYTRKFTPEQVREIRAAWERIMVEDRKGTTRTRYGEGRKLAERFNTNRVTIRKIAIRETYRDIV